MPPHSHTECSRVQPAVHKYCLRPYRDGSKRPAAVQNGKTLPHTDALRQCNMPNTNKYSMTLHVSLTKASPLATAGPAAVIAASFT